MRIQNASFTATLAAVVALGASPAPAHACINGIRQRVDHRIEYLVRAERHLRRRRHQRAVSWALRAYPGLRRVRGVSRRTPRKVLRGLTVVALAALRTDGALAMYRGKYRNKQARQPSARARHSNVRWAIRTIKNLARLRPRSVRLRGHLGEALAKDAKTRARARAILERLAKRDLIVSAEAYAALAKLRRRAGDAAGAKSALARCQRMAGRHSAVCRIGKPPRVAALR